MNLKISEAIVAIQHTDAPAAFSLGFHGLGAWLLARIERGLEWMMEHGSGAARVRSAQALQALSDAELAKRGLKRDEIVMHVFRDVFYL